MRFWLDEPQAAIATAQIPTGKRDRSPGLSRRPPCVHEAHLSTTPVWRCGDNKGITLLPPGYAPRRKNSYVPRGIAVAIACCGLLAACGSSSKSGATTSNDHAQGVKFASCMRDHGVSSFPDPEAGAGIQIPVSLANNPSPAFTSAMHACKYLIPAGGGPPPESASQKAADLRLAQCMREHGVPNYPDPTYQDGHEIPPAIANPAINPASPAFGAASKTCQSS